MTDHAGLRAKIARYYTGKIVEHGPVARGVDWNDAPSQELRFAQILRIGEGRPHFTLNDYGCGYGALLGFLRARGQTCEYAGFDISEEMIQQARQRHCADSAARFAVSDAPEAPADFTVASGLFNVKLDTPPAAWRAYLLETLGHMDRVSKAGFAFNCLTRYSDPERMRDDLYYADPAELFDYCKRRFSRNVALLHDYGLYEFTILVRKA
jgi:SAM-dependent methyltransferase